MADSNRNLPLNKKYVSVKHPYGEEERIPALHPKWREEMQFIVYTPPLSSEADEASWQEWKERLEFIEADLQAVLKLPHDKFWCQIVFDESLQKCLDSYLRHAPRPHDKSCILHDTVKDTHNSIHKLFFLVYLRMSTHKESKEAFITPNVFGDILYENYLFDVPKLLDLCILYGPNNQPLVVKMIENIFSKQPNYNDDLQQVVPTVLQVVDTIESRLGLRKTPASPPQLLSASNIRDALGNLSEAEVNDVLLYLTDTVLTLNAFVDIYPASTKCFRAEDFATRLGSHYDGLVSSIPPALKNKDWSDVEKKRITEKLCQVQYGLLHLFRNIVFQTCLQPLLELNPSDVEKAEEYVEDYYQVMSSVLGERRFLGHYESLFPFKDDRDLLAAAPYVLDDTRMQFLEEGITEAYATYGKSKSGSKPRLEVSMAKVLSKESGIKFMGMPTEYADYDVGAGGRQEVAGAAANSVTITAVEMDSLIINVKDLLPDLGEGFVQLCLEWYDYDLEKTINSILEDRLPPTLQECDRELPRVTRQYDAVPDTFLGQRANVYDDDEFDVFSRDKVDTSLIHVGKKDKEEVVLQDSKSMETTKALVHQYSLVEDFDGSGGCYNDEYDDTYDDNAVGAHDADSADELTNLRPFTTPRILGQKTREVQEYYSEESDSEEPVNRDRFVEDPAKIRARQAERWASKQARTQKKHPPGNAPPRNRDVVGNAKGQGQDSTVIRNRQNKEKNKASRVNHNRKAMSDKKRLPKF